MRTEEWERKQPEVFTSEEAAQAVVESTRGWPAAHTRPVYDMYGVTIIGYVVDVTDDLILCVDGYTR